MGDDPLLYDLRRARERHDDALRRLNALLNREDPSPDILHSAIAEEKDARERVDELVAALRLFEESSC